MSIGLSDDAVLWSIEYSTDGGAPMPLTGSEVIRPDPTQEYVAGGRGYFRGTGEAVLPDTIDDLTKAFGYRAYDVMTTFPAVSASLRTLKLGIMSGEIKLTPTFPLSPGQKEPDADQVESGKAVEFCQRAMDRVPGFRGSILQLLDCPEIGNKLAEKTYRVETTGPDAGKLVLDRLSVKRRDAWGFVIDRSYQVTGIITRGQGGLRERIDPGKFMWFTWMPRDNDPRGTSILRAAYSAWNLAVKLYPQYYKYLTQFAVASLVGKTAPLEKDRTVDGVVYTPQHYMRLILERFQNGSVVVVPFGAEVNAIEVKGEGQAFLNAYEFFNREIVYSVLMQTRATKEAEFGSKADSEKGGDILGLLIQYGQEMAGETLRNQLFKQVLSLNFGDEYADRYAPYVFFGSGDPSDAVERWNAFANLFGRGAITPSITEEAYALFGLPVPDMDADREVAMEAISIAQSSMQGGPPLDDDGGSNNPPDDQDDTDSDEE